VCARERERSGGWGEEDRVTRKDREREGRSVKGMKAFRPFIFIPYPHFMLVIASYAVSSYYRYKISS
jgi:hypothetical protein